MDPRMLNSRRGDDRISQLSDDLLISIISELTLKDATATSILSTRWRYLYHYVPHLIFPEFIEMNLAFLEQTDSRRFSKYVKSINGILDSHKGCRVKELRMQMPCLKGADVDKWLEFALAKEVEIIKIEMRYPTLGPHGHYLFHLETLLRRGLSFKGLKELCLGLIQVDDSEIEILLSNCPCLERLSIRFSNRLGKMSILGRPAYMLKHLEIYEAPCLKFIEIDSMIHLVSFHFHHLWAYLDVDHILPYVLTLNEVPNLVEFSITVDEFGCTPGQVFSRVSSSICDQLTTLKLLFLHSSPLLQEMLPQFKSVKYLQLQQCAGSPRALNPSRLFDMIQTCPSLEKLEIKMMWERNRVYFPEDDGKCESVSLSPYLKKIKFSGFLGSSAELGLALSILRKMGNNYLEEFNVEACDVTEKIRELATACAWQHFRPILPDSVTFLVN